MVVGFPARRVKRVGAMNSDTDTDEEGVLIRQAVQLQQHQEHVATPSLAPLPPPAASHLTLEAPPIVPPPPRATTPKGGKGRSSSRRPAGAITIKTLVDAGLLIPGTSVLYVDYKGNSTFADLSSEGQIHCKGLVFDSPSAFSIYIKRLVNPTRKADDGWKAVKYNGKLLEAYKDEYLRRIMPGSTSLQSSEAAPGLGGSLDMPGTVLAPAPPPPLPSTSSAQSGRGVGPPAKRHRSGAHHAAASPPAPDLPIQPSLPPLTTSTDGGMPVLMQQQGSRGPPVPPPPPLPALSHGFTSNLWPGPRAGLSNDSSLLLPGHTGVDAPPLGIQPMIELNSTVSSSPR